MNPRVPMQLHILDTADDSVRAEYDCRCGCQPTVTYQRTAAPVREGCCCGNEFAVGPHATVALEGKAGYRQESTSFGAPRGETVPAAWLIGPSVHADEPQVHTDREAQGGAHGHDHDAHDEGPEAATDLVCGMSVNPQTAEAKALRSTYGDRDFHFCGRGCKLDFDEDPERYLDPSYVPSM